MPVAIRISPSVPVTPPKFSVPVISTPFSVKYSYSPNGICQIIFPEFKLIDNKWHNQRQLEDYKRTVEKINHRAEAGRKGGLAKAKQTSSKLSVSDSVSVIVIVVRFVDAATDAVMFAPTSLNVAFGA